MTENQPTSTDNTSNAPLTTASIVSASVLVGLVLSAIVVLTLFNRPIDNVLIIMSAVIAPTIGTILAARKLDTAKSILHDVSIKVNGRLDGALNTISALEQQVIGAGQIPVTKPNLVIPATPVPRHSAENPPTSQEVTN